MALLACAKITMKSMATLLTKYLLTETSCKLPSTRPICPPKLDSNFFDTFWSLLLFVRKDIVGFTIIQFNSFSLGPWCELKCYANVFGIFTLQKKHNGHRLGIVCSYQGYLKSTCTEN